MTITLKMPAKWHRPTLPKVRLPRVGRNVAQVAAQLVGALAVLVGVSAWSVAAAFILGGLTVILAVERQAT